jgi:hypothetical protein
MPQTNDKSNEPYPAEKARGGEIVLRKRWQRIVFIGALALPSCSGFFCRCGAADRQLPDLPPATAARNGAFSASSALLPG